MSCSCTVSVYFATLVMSVEDRSWMYQGWNRNGHHSREWVRNTDGFLDHQPVRLAGG
jgi:hypothetical protein